MLVVPDLPLDIPSDAELIPELSLLRQDAAQAIDEGSSTSLMNKFDVHLEFTNALLCYQSNHPDPDIEKLICVTMINMAYFYEQVYERLVQKAYQEDSKEAWSNSSNYNKKCIGLLRFLADSKVATNAQLLGLVQTYVKCWTLSQQLSMVILSLSKLKSQVCGGRTAGPASYERLLQFQESDLKVLAKASLLYARLCIGCRESCSQLAHTELSRSCQPLSLYLEALTFLFMSLDCYKNDKCGEAIGMLEAASCSLSNGLISKKQLKLIQDSKKAKEKLVSRFKEIKMEGSKLRTKMNPFKKSESRAEAGLHPFLQSTLEDFIIPLIMLLQYRYVRANDKVFFQPVVINKEELKGSWPQGMTPELAGTNWIFDGEQLTEEAASTTNYF